VAVAGRNEFLHQRGLIDPEINRAGFHSAGE
jgi:hypothetical protein